MCLYVSICQAIGDVEAAIQRGSYIQRQLYIEAAAVYAYMLDDRRYRGSYLQRQLFIEAATQCAERAACVHVVECVVIQNVFSYRMCSHTECVRIQNVFSYRMCSHIERVLIQNVFSYRTCSDIECVLISNVFSY